MSPIGPTERSTVLEPAPGITVRVHSGSNVELRLDGRSVQGGRHLLAILDAFVHPRSVASAIDRLRARATGPQDWMEMTGTLMRLVRAGALRDAEATEPTVEADPFTFDSAPEHVAMLNDRVRTERFMAGIRQVVRPGDVVVEVGTGTGILSIAAARAGARHVYAIEAGAIGKLAREMFAANGHADRITLIEGWSTEVTLPERADVLVSEIIGNDPLGEGVLEFTADAVRRLLRPGGRLVPSRLRVYGLPVTVPRDRLLKRTFAEATVRRWADWYGIGFDPLRRAAARAPHFFYIWPQLAREWPVLADPIPLAEIDLARIRGTSVDGTARFTATGEGTLSGVLVYFELDLGPGTRLSTHPAEADSDNCWSSPVWITPEPLPVAPGQALAATYSYRVHGRRDGIRVERLASPGRTAESAEPSGRIRGADRPQVGSHER